MRLSIKDRATWLEQLRKGWGMKWAGPATE
jgi:hypothetical protein